MYETISHSNHVHPWNFRVFFSVPRVDSRCGFSDDFDTRNQCVLQFAILMKLLKSNILYKPLCFLSGIQNVA